MQGRSLAKKIQWFIGSELRQRLKITAMHRVIRELEKRNINLAEMDALEMFGGTAEVHLQVYAPLVKSIEVWEIDPKLEPIIRAKVPQAKIKITDTIQETKKAARRFNLIVCDNPVSNYGVYCENFELFPDFFKLVAPPAVLMINVIPSVGQRVKSRMPAIFNEDQLRRRKEFYGTGDPSNIDHETLAQAYIQRAKTAGLTTDWYFIQPRTSVTGITFLHYLVMHVR